MYYIHLGDSVHGLDSFSEAPVILNTKLVNFLDNLFHSSHHYLSVTSEQLLFKFFMGVRPDFLLMIIM